MRQGWVCGEAQRARRLGLETTCGSGRMTRLFHWRHDSHRLATLPGVVGAPGENDELVMRLGWLCSPTNDQLRVDSSLSGDARRYSNFASVDTMIEAIGAASTLEVLIEREAATSQVQGLFRLF